MQHEQESVVSGQAGAHPCSLTDSSMAAVYGERTDDGDNELGSEVGSGGVV